MKFEPRAPQDKTSYALVSVSVVLLLLEIRVKWKWAGAEHHQRVEPPAGLVQSLGDEVGGEEVVDGILTHVARNGMGGMVWG